MTDQRFEPEAGAPSAAPTADSPDLEATIVEPPVAPPDAPSLSPVARPRPGALRWGIALGVVGIVLAFTAIGYVALSAGAALSGLAGWVPADTYVYGEVRLDPPGDQQERLGDLLARFPGFDDQAILDQKITEALDQMAGSMGAAGAYSEVKPWLGDTAAFALHGDPDFMGKDVPTLALVATKDPVAARAWFAAKTAAAGEQATTETYAGAELTLDASGDYAYAILDTVILAGDTASVKAAVDTNGASGFASDPEVKAAADAIEDDVLAFGFVDVRRMMDIAARTAPEGVDLFTEAALAKVPAWAAFSTRARSDALEMDVVAPVPDGTPARSTHASEIAARLPASTVAVVEAHDLGAAITGVLDDLKAQPETKDVATQIEQALAMFGGADALVGWLGDGSLAVTAANGGMDGGLVISTDDEQAASDTFAQLRNLVALAGATSGISIQDTPYGAGTITTVDLGDLGALAGMAGQQLDVPAGTRAAFAYTVQGGLVVLGGEGFVKAVVDTQAGASLADQERYRQAIELAGASNQGQGYVDLAGIVSAVEPLLPADERARFESEIRPYVEPIGALAFTATGTDVARARAVLTFR